MSGAPLYLQASDEHLGVGESIRVAVREEAAVVVMVKRHLFFGLFFKVSTTLGPHNFMATQIEGVSAGSRVLRSVCEVREGGGGVGAAVREQQRVVSWPAQGFLAHKNPPPPLGPPYGPRHSPTIGSHGEAVSQT